MGTSFKKYNPIKKSFFAFEHSEQENVPVILGIEVTQKNEELDVTQYFNVNDLAKISDHIKSSIKANLIITDSNVLNKEVNTIGTDQEILAEAYPNLDINDFYYQILKTSQKSFVAICRKEYVHAIIDQYKKVNILITTVDLGSFKVSSLLSYFKDATLLTHNSSIKSSSEEIFSIHNDNCDKEEYIIDTLKIPSTYILPFASILYTVTNQSIITGNIEEKNTELISTYKETQFFKKTLQYGIVFLLISLLINFFIFNSKYKTLQNLQEEQQVYATQKENIEKQQSIVSTKEGIVNSIITTGFSKSSYFVDQITQLQPSTVILKSLNYQPLAKTIRNDKPLTIKNKTILITGDSSDKTSFTNWINKIESLYFVNQVTIVNYGLDKKNISLFEIAINLTDDTEK